MRDALKLFSCSNKNMDLQMHKYITAISLNTPCVEVLKHHCYSKEFCAFVGLYCNNWIIIHGITNVNKFHLRCHSENRSMKYRRRRLLQAVLFCLLNDVVTSPVIISEWFLNSPQPLYSYLISRIKNENIFYLTSLSKPSIYSAQLWYEF